MDYEPSSHPWQSRMKYFLASKCSLGPDSLMKIAPLPIESPPAGKSEADNSEEEDTSSDDDASDDKDAPSEPVSTDFRTPIIEESYYKP